MEAVLNIKNVPDKLAKAVVADYERGLTSAHHALCVAVGDLHRRMALPARVSTTDRANTAAICLRAT